MAGTARRLLAYFVNDQVTAESLQVRPREPIPDWLARPDWIARAADDAGLAEYALDAARRTCEWADASVAALQSKASTFLALVLGLVPVALGATVFALPGPGSAVLRELPFVAFAVGDACLITAAVFAGLASGLVLASGPHLGRMEKPAGRLAGKPSTAQVAALKSEEAYAWHCAALRALQSGDRVALDLFASRRWVVLALLAFAIGTVVLVIAVNGNVSALLNH